MNKPLVTLNIPGRTPEEISRMMAALPEPLVERLNARLQEIAEEVAQRESDLLIYGQSVTFTPSSLTP